MSCHAAYAFSLFNGCHDIFAIFFIDAADIFDADISRFSSFRRFAFHYYAAAARLAAMPPPLIDILPYHDIVFILPLFFAAMLDMAY